MSTSLLLIPQQQEEEEKTCQRREKKTPRSTVLGQVRTHSRNERTPQTQGQNSQNAGLGMHSCYKRLSLLPLSRSSRWEAIEDCLPQTFFASPSPAWSLFSCSVFICMPLMAKRLTFPWFLVFKLPFRLSICVPPMPFVGDDVST
jgi:hypothetical protein